MNKPELLAPAGNLEKLKTAFLYGADAVYFGGTEFSLRNAADNFTEDEIKEGLTYAHNLSKKCYCAVNIFPRNDELKRLPAFLEKLAKLGVDGLILSDLGVFNLAQKYAPEIPVHISTQANTVNYESASLWHRMGAKRIILARELSLQEIEEIRNNTPKELELEAFVHGAMCISYSGRCLLSNYLAGRDSNRGLCAHPCRWKYYLMEETRPNEYFAIEQGEKGAFIMNSKDLCMIAHIPELIKAGLTSLKIEGRVKSAYYVATVTNAYRQAIDAYCDDPQNYVFDDALYDEVCKVSHRDYYTGFYFGDQKENAQIYTTSSYIRDYDIVAMVDRYDEKTGRVYCTQKNRFFDGDTVEVLSPGQLSRAFVVTGLLDGEANPIDKAPHPEMKVSFIVPFALSPNDMIRRAKETN